MFGSGHSHGLYLQLIFAANICSWYLQPCCAGDDLGAVECSDVAMADLPPPLEDTRVFALTLRGNGLRKFPLGKLRGMGAYLFIYLPQTGLPLIINLPLTNHLVRCLES